MGASLTIRAERALLGALITQPGLADELSFVERADFSSARHADIFAAIRYADLDDALPAGARRARIVTVAGQQPDGELDLLASRCPDPAHGSVYAGMVLEAQVRRLLTAHADRLSADAGSLGYDSRRLIRVAGDRGYEPENLARHMARVGVAMRSHANAFDPATASVITGPALPAGLGDPVRSPAFRAAGPAAWAMAATRVAGYNAREQSEERILAALLQHHPDSGGVLDTLPSTGFTDPARRIIFTTIRDLHRRDHPVDPLIVDWEIARHGSDILDAAHEDRRHSGESYATRLADLAVGPSWLLALVTEAVLRGRYRAHALTPRDIAAASASTKRLDAGRPTGHPGQRPAQPDPAPLIGPPPDRTPGPGDRLPRP